MCPKCGRPIDACACARAKEDPQAAGNKTLVARLRLETKGRGGKTVTVIDGLTIDAASLEALARDLKRACGTGGSVGDGTIELQGDRRARVRDLLAPKGFRVKG